MSDKKCSFCGCTPKGNLKQCEKCGNIICAPYINGKLRECACSKVCEGCGGDTCVNCIRMDTATFNTLC